MEPVSRISFARSTQAVLRIAVTVPAVVGVLWWLTSANGQPKTAAEPVTVAAPEVSYLPGPHLATGFDDGSHATVFIVDSDEAADQLRISLQDGHSPSAWLTGYPALGEVLVAEDADRIASELGECERTLAGLDVPRVGFVRVASR